MLLISKGCENQNYISKNNYNKDEKNLTNNQGEVKNSKDKRKKSTYKKTSSKKRKKYNKIRKATKTISFRNKGLTYLKISKIAAILFLTLIFLHFLNRKTRLINSKSDKDIKKITPGAETHFKDITRINKFESYLRKSNFKSQRLIEINKFESYFRSNLESQRLDIEVDTNLTQEAYFTSKGLEKPDKVCLHIYSSNHKYLMILRKIKNEESDFSIGINKGRMLSYFSPEQVIITNDCFSFLLDKSIKEKCSLRGKTGVFEVDLTELKFKKLIKDILHTAGQIIELYSNISPEGRAGDLKDKHLKEQIRLLFEDLNQRMSEQKKIHQNDF